MRKQLLMKKFIWVFSSFLAVAIVLFLSYQGYWFIRDFGKNKYDLTIEEYIQPETKESAGVWLELAVKNPKEETIRLTSTSGQLISMEALESVNIDGLDVLPEEKLGSSGVKIKVKKSEVQQSFKILLPIVRDSSDQIEIYRGNRKIKSKKINYEAPKQEGERKQTSAFFKATEPLYATTGNVQRATNNYEMFGLPIENLVQHFSPKNTKVVMNYQQLIAALKDKSIDGIEFGANISGTTELPRVNRSLLIDGKNFTFSSTTTLNATRAFQLDKASAPQIFMFKNVKVNIQNSIGLIRTYNQNDSNWLISVENISNVYQSNVGRFVYAPSATLVMTGEVNWKSGRSDEVLYVAEVLVTDQAKISVEGISTIIRMHPGNRVNTVFVIEKGSTLKLHSRDAQAIYANYQGYLNKVHFEARGEGTVLNATSNASLIDFYGATIALCGSSDNSSEKKKSITKVSDGAKINIHSLGKLTNKKNAQPAMINQVTDGNFYVDGAGSELNLISEGEGNNIGAVLRFRLVGGQTFIIENKGKVSITKNAGTASAIRLYGQGNQFFVKKGGQLQIDNHGDKSNGGLPTDGGDTGGKQGVQFPIDSSSGTSIFSLEGKGSEVYINAELGPALWTQYGNLRFLVGKDTVFRAEGRTKNQNYGIVQAARSADFEIDQPRFYDLRNNRPHGGQVFSTSSGTFKAQKSYLSVWEIKNNVNLDTDPDAFWAPISYTLSGSYFEKIVNTDYPDEFNTTTYKGANKYTRMSGNGSAPYVDELRVPTNADKTIYGHVSVKVGYGDEVRDAWENEVWVTVRISRNGKILSEEVVPTKGINNNLPGIKQWDDEKARGGIFVVKMADFLQAGDVVEVMDAHRGRKDTINSTEEEIILVEPVTTVDVTPPMALTIEEDLLSNSSDTITNATKQIKGTIDMYDKRDDKLMKSVYIFAKLNGKLLQDTIVEVKDTATSANQTHVNWTINLPRYLEAEEEIEIYAKDISEIGDLQDKSQLITYSQEPNDIGGNVMPSPKGYSAYLGYHDAVKTTRFPPAKLLRVKDILPEGLRIEANEVESSTKEKEPGTGKDINITRVGSRLTYSGTVISKNEINTSTSQKIVKDTKISIQIPADLNRDTLTYSFKKKKILESDDKAVEITTEYDPETGLLSTEKGKIDLSKEDEIIFGFSGEVTRIPEGSVEFGLEMKAEGKSPREDIHLPGGFIPGEVDETRLMILEDKKTMLSPMPKGGTTDPDPVIEDGTAYVRLSVVNKKLTAYYRNVNKIAFKIDGENYKTYNLKLETAEKSIILDIPINQHRRNITAEYYFPDPNNSADEIKKIATWNKGKWAKEVDDAINNQ